MDISSVFTSITMMGIIVLFGALVGSRITITNEAKQLLVAIIVNIALPAIILNGVFNTEIDDRLLQNILLIFLLSVFINIIGFTTGWFSGRLLGFSSSDAKSIGVIAGLGNSGFIGIPLCAELFGPIGGLLAAIFDAGLDVVVFSFVILMLQQEQRFSIKRFKTLLNIPFIAIVTGLTIAIIGLEPPVIAKNLAGFLSSLAAPLAMIYIGLLIPEFFRKERKVRFKFVSISLVYKLFIFPLVMIPIIKILPIDTMIQQVCYVLVTMPTIMLAPVILAKYSKNDQAEDVGAIATIYSTVLSLATIPFILYIANSLI